MSTLFAGKRLDELDGNELAVGQTFSDPDANISWSEANGPGGSFLPTTLDYVVTALSLELETIPCCYLGIVCGD
jgi:hypothetical protein